MGIFATGGEGPGSAGTEERVGVCQYLRAKGIAAARASNSSCLDKCNIYQMGDGLGVQVTQMIATGPKPPLSFNSSNDESPVKLNIGGGMGEHAR